MPRRGRWSEAGRGLFGLLRLGACAVGVPGALVALVATIAPGSAGVPWPQGIPGLDEVRTSLSSPGQIPASVLIKAVALVGWLAWLELTAAVVVDIASRLRGRVPRPLRLPLAGPSQAVAGRLVASAALITALWWQPPKLAAASTPTPVTAVIATPPAARPSEVAIDGRSLPPTPGTKVHVVRPGDWLSKIAETHLGAWRRYPEISALNRGRPQPDGQALVDDDLIRPGWVLVMPGDAVGVDVVAPARNDGPDAPPEPAPRPERVPQPDPVAPPPSTVGSNGTAVPVASSPPQPAPRIEVVSTAKPRGNDGRQSPARRAASVGVPGIVAAAALHKLWSLRQAQQRRRRRGHELPKADPSLQAVEAKARAVSTAEAGAWVDLTLRYLGAGLAGWADDQVPAIDAVRAGSFGVEILLDRACPRAPQGFVAADHGHVWRLGADIDLDELRRLAGDEDPLIPALLTIGTTAEGPLLIDLERAGTLSVEGDTGRVDAFLAGAALELASAPWASDTFVRLIGGDDKLSNLELVETVDDATALIDQGWEHPDLAGAASTLAGRAAPEAIEIVPPTVIVARAPIGVSSVMSRLASLAQPGVSGLAVVAPGPLHGTAWRVIIDATGAAVLEPLGLRLTCAVDREMVDGLADLLSVAASEEQGPRLPVPVADETSDPPALKVAERSLVRVLGPVEVPFASRPARLARCEEIVAYLATHPGRRVPRDRLRVAIHPIRDDGRAGEVADGTFRAEMSRVRVALGKDPDGKSYLPTSTTEGYVVGMASDWSMFQSKSASAKRTSSTEAMELLRQALDLVRDRPFVDVPENSYGWAWAEGLVSEIEIAVAEAAESLADLALAAGDAALSRWAARQGLLAIPSREDLYQAWMRAAAAAENWDDLDQAWRGVWRAVRAIDPLERPRSDTLSLYGELRPKSDDRGSSTQPSVLSAPGVI